MEELQPEHTSGQWRLFIDSSAVSWKAALLQNGNKLHFVPQANAVYVKEMNENLQVLLQKIFYVEHWWNIMCWLKSYSNANWAAGQIH